MIKKSLQKFDRGKSKKPPFKTENSIFDCKNFQNFKILKNASDKVKAREILPLKILRLSFF